MLLNKDRVSAKELAERFGVSVRTIYRDVDAISMAGIPITSYAGKQGGFKIIDTFKLDRQLLTMKDTLAIISALKGINGALENKDLDSAIDKITCLVPNDKIDILEDYLKHISIEIGSWGQKSQQDYLKLINNAIANKRIIKFKYENAKVEIITRRVEPMTLIFKGYAWYLFAFCLYRNDYRLFRLSRIKELICLEESFTRKKKTHQEYFNESYNSEMLIEVILKFSIKIKQKVIEYFGNNNVIEEIDDSLVVKFKSPDDDYLYSIILSFGEYVEVLSPMFVRVELQKRLKNILALYKHDIMVS